MDYANKSLKAHEQWQGKLSIVPKMKIESKEDLSIVYTPGVAAPCLAIQNNPDLSFSLTSRWNTVAVISDGSAVLGLGDIGPEASMPVMEGKSILFKKFGDIDAIPLCIKSKNVDDIVNTIALLEGSFGGVNLEDISAPRCFEIEKKLQERCSIPIFHDDQHGTAIVTLSAMINALKYVKKDIEKIKIIISGAGAAGIAIAKLLIATGAKNIIICDSKGAIFEGRENLNKEKEEIAAISNPEKKKGSLFEVIKNTDVFIGVSRPDILSEEMVRSMSKDPIIFAMANPMPEIMPDIAYKAGASIVGTGRSDFPNQINNVLAFPGIFRGALDVRAREINDEMKLAASYAIANLVSAKDLSKDYIVPSIFDERIKGAVSKAVAAAAIDTGVARKI